MTQSKVERFLSQSFRRKFDLVFFLVRYLVRKIMNQLLSKVAGVFINTRIGREVYFNAMPRNQLLVTKTIEDIHYIVNSSDKVIGKSVYRDRKSFDANHLTNALKIITKPRSILLDVGANIGTIGLLGVSKGYFEKCIAFEPDPYNFEILTHNVSLNGLKDKFELRNEALSNEANGCLDFELSEENYGDHRIRIKSTSGIYNEANRRIISVSVNTLDRALKDVNLDDCVLFMDTQGYEGHVLSGASRVIQSNTPIVTEFWPYGLERAGGLELFYEVLSNSGYTSMWNLKNPEKKLSFSIINLKKIAMLTGNDGEFTDLLFIRD